MPKLFKIDVPLFATAYIKAKDETEALNIAQAELCDRGIEFNNGYQGIEDAICMDGRPFECLFDNEEDIALSPAMTLSATRFSPAQIEEVENG